MTRWGTYYGKRYKTWRLHGEALLPLCPVRDRVDVPCSLSVTFAIPRSKTSQLLTPIGDGDNYEKAFYDLLQKRGYLLDDRLITTATWRKRFVQYEQPGWIEVNIYEELEEIDI